MIFDVLNRATVRTFKEAVTWHDSTREKDGIFDSRHFVVEGEEIGVSTLITTLSIEEDSDDPVDIGETLTVRETEYRVKDKRPDGQGMTVLELEDAP